MAGILLKKKSIDLMALAILIVLLILKLWAGWSWWTVAWLPVSWLVITALGSFNVQWNYHLTSACKNPGTALPELALTFDDGPHPEFTPQVLDLLNRYQAKATFFIVGRHVAQYPDIVGRILAEGHVVGNHTWSHSRRFGFFSTSTVTADLEKCRYEVNRVAGLKMRLYRPAFGVTNPMIRRAVQRLDLQSVGWNIRTYDTTSLSEDRLFSNISRRLGKGDIVLLHDTSNKTVRVLERLLVFLQEKGLRAVSVDRLLGIEAYDQL